jgi:hypothetical protein
LTAGKGRNQGQPSNKTVPQKQPQLQAPRLLLSSQMPPLQLQMFNALIAQKWDTMQAVFVTGIQMLQNGNDVTTADGNKDTGFCFSQQNCDGNISKD